MAIIPTITEKCTGALIASAIGDALGWPYEFRASNTSKNKMINGLFIEWERYNRARYGNHREQILAGEYSDDTQMILAVARSIISSDWKTTLSKSEIPFWINYERGGGRALKKAAQILSSGIMPWESYKSEEYFNAGGNGAVMRILPHVIARADKYKIKEIIEEVIIDSIFTHGHPRAILGSACYAYALYLLYKKDTVLEYGDLIDSVIEGENKWNLSPETIALTSWHEAAEKSLNHNYFKIWSECVMDMIEKLKFIRESLKKGLLVNDKDVLSKLGCFDKKINGAGDVAVLSSLYLMSKYANNPVLGIKTAAFSIGADTDTIASITGGFLGMLCGTSWIPAEWKTVQDYNCFVNIAELLLADDMIEATKKVTNQYKSKYNDWERSPIGKVRTVSTSVVPSGNLAVINIMKVENLLGQTFYLKKYERIETKKIDIPSSINDLQKIESNTFKLNMQDLKELIENPLLETIRLKKILQIIEVVMRGRADYEVIAKKFKVDKKIVEIINSFIIKN